MPPQPARDSADLPPMPGRTRATFRGVHQHERALAGVGTPEYDRLLHQSFYDAEAVLVLNPITAAMLEPFARRVCIVPWGIDPARFPVSESAFSGQWSVVGGLEAPDGAGRGMPTLRRKSTGHRRSQCHPEEGHRHIIGRHWRSQCHPQEARKSSRPCSWRRWPASSSRGFMSRTRRAGSCGRRGSTSSWW